MKIPISNFQFPIFRRRAKTPAGGGIAVRNRQSSIVNRKFREGVALIITLILLAVTLVMAIAFLALSRRESTSVNTSTDTATARLASDSALSAAQGQIVASVLANPAAAYNFGLLVSTNYVNDNLSDPYYTTYFNTNTGTLLSGPAFETAVTNQFVMPRPPVFITNALTGSNDFRYYLDLNRNGSFEATGDQVPNVESLNGQPHTNGFGPETGDPQWIGVLEHPNQPAGPDNPFVSRYAFFAQPIGNSLDLNHIYNQVFDENSQGILVSPNYNDAYFRNQGVGSWELNLAAFLCDLNTTEWGRGVGTPTGDYWYQRTFRQNQGVAFYDAQALLAYRYDNNYRSLANGENSFNRQLLYNYPTNIDGYSDGPLQTTVDYNAAGNPNTAPIRDNLFYPWAGADSTNRFFSLPSDLFDPTKCPGGVTTAPGITNFTSRLLDAGGPGIKGFVSTYNRYTFYRMLDQMGTDSQAPENQMNLNYSNAVVQYDAYGVVDNISIIPGAETNLVPWRPLDFFTAAADRMLKTYTANWLAADNTANHYDYTNTFGVTNAFGITNIPVYVNGRFVYSPAVNRLLQLAANMYDATTNSANPYNPAIKDYPSVFRPMFNVVNQNGYKNVYIDGYEQVVNSFQAIDGFNRSYPGPLIRPVNVTDLNFGQQSEQNVYGVPWIIGAKKGFPGFNQFYMLNAVKVTRKLMVSKPSFGAALDQFTTNQMYVFSISNSLGCSFWNSYTNDYRGNISIVVNGHLSMYLTNATSSTPLASFNNTYYGAPSPYTTNDWPGTSWQAAPPVTALNNTNAFIAPLHLTITLLTNSIYRYGAPGYFDAVNPNYQTTVTTPALPQFGLRTTNRLQAYILDNGHVIDYVQFAGPEGSRNLSAELADSGISTGNNVYLWSTNPVSASDPNGTPWGVPNQISVSRGDATPVNYSAKFWEAPPNLPNYLPKTPDAEKVFFNAFFNVNRLQYGVYIYHSKRYTNAALTVQAPYTPTRMLYDYTMWEVNDPLVHSLASQLNYQDPGVTGVQRSDDPNNFLPKVAFNTLSKAYSPWGRNLPTLATSMSTATSTGTYVDGTWQTALKDPLVWRPDDWDFPTYKLPTPGWLGRVHRGTPWQTVYLKATDINALNGNAGANSWAAWTGDRQTVNNTYFDARNSRPAQDAWLFDLFTTRLNENAAKGTLSVNQPGLASWSAVLSGSVALTNSGPNVIGYQADPPVTNVIVQPAGPAGTNSPLGWIVSSINSTRTNFVNPNSLKGVFESTGDVLRAPALSDQSPFLNTSSVNQQHYAISDQLYEWLPQQILGLLRVSSTPRYVIYCYGQTLRPAPNGTILSGTDFGLVTNYQVTAESDARAVVRVNRNLVRDSAGNVTGTNYTTTVESYNPLPPD